jgi:hypothetical protein
MFTRILAYAFLLFLATSTGDSSARSQPRDNTDRVLRGLLEPTREISFDVCFPATGQEYVALGKHAIVMLTSSSAISSELPLRSVYVMRSGVRVPLHRIALLEKHVDSASSRATQVSFYLLPIQLMKTDAVLLADFTGERSGFSISRFSATNGLDPSAPAFARLDEYDTPSDPDPAVIAQVLAREYPDYFR